MSKEKKVILFLSLIIVFILVFFEYIDHDCLNDKKCNYNISIPNENLSKKEYIKETIEMINKNNNYVVWRQSLIVSLLASLVIILYLEKFNYISNVFIFWFIILVIIFLFSYLSYNWIWSHFLSPNNEKIVETILKINNIF